MKMFWLMFFLGSMFVIGFDVHEQRRAAQIDPGLDVPTTTLDSATTTLDGPMTMSDPWGLPPGN